MAYRTGIGAVWRCCIAGSALAVLFAVAAGDDAMAGPSGGKGPAASPVWDCGAARIARMVPQTGEPARPPTVAVGVEVKSGVGDTDSAARTAFAEAARRALAEAGLFADQQADGGVKLEVTIDRGVVSEYGSRYLVMAVAYRLARDGRPVWSGRIVTDGEVDWWLVDPCAQALTSFEAASRDNLGQFVEGVRRTLRAAEPPAGDDSQRRPHLPLPARRKALG